MTSTTKEAGALAELREQLDELIGQPIRVDEGVLENCRKNNSFGELSFNLFKEAAVLVWVTANVRYQTEGDEMSLARNQAVCVGLLSRVAKLMMSVLKLSSSGEHGGSAQILNRCIFESTVDLQLLLEKDDDAIYGRFIATGLKGDRALYDLINSNIRQRNGRILEIEQSMLGSICRICEDSGLTIEDIDPKAGNWGGSYRDKLRALGREDAYPILQSTLSQSVHGSWSDLIRNYLDKNEGEYSPKPDHARTDGKMFGPIALAATDAAKAYIGRYFDPTDAGFLLQRLDDWQRRMVLVEEARPGWELA